MINLNNFGVMYNAHDKTTGNSVSINVIYLDEILMACNKHEDFKKGNLDTFPDCFTKLDVPSPCHVTYYRSKNQSENELISEAISQAIIEKNNYVLIDNMD